MNINKKIYILSFFIASCAPNKREFHILNYKQSNNSIYVEGDVQLPKFDISRIDLPMKNYTLSVEECEKNNNGIRYVPFNQNVFVDNDGKEIFKAMLICRARYTKIYDHMVMDAGPINWNNSCINIYNRSAFGLSLVLKTEKGEVSKIAKGCVR